MPSSTAGPGDDALGLPAAVPFPGVVHIAASCIVVAEQDNSANALGPRSSISLHVRTELGAAEFPLATVPTRLRILPKLEVLTFTYNQRDPEVGGATHPAL